MTKSAPIERHPLQPFLPENSRLLMLGSFPPSQNRWTMNFFYPNSQNSMWRIYGLIFFNDVNHFYNNKIKKFRQSQIEDFLRQKGIAVFDTAIAVRRLKGTASDQFLEIVEPTPLEELLKQIPQCRAIVATGGKAATEICEQIGLKQPQIGQQVWSDTLGVRLYRMPSSSRTYPLSIDQKAAFYRAMFQAESLL